MKLAAATLAFGSVVAHGVMGAPTAAQSDQSAQVRSSGPTMRTADDILSDPFVAAYLESQQATDSGRKEDNSQLSFDDFRIVNGFAARSEFPWFASISMIVGLQADGRATIGMCGGSLIAPSTVLTAAHCFAGENGDSGYMEPEMLRVGPGASDVIPNMIVQLGGNEQRFMIDNGMVQTRRRTAAKAPPGKTQDTTTTSASTAAPSTRAYEQRAGVQVICHPGYDPKLQINDICLLILDQPSTHAPVKLNFETNLRSAAQVAASEAPGVNATALGFGDTSFQGNMSPYLLEATMPIIGLQQCKRMWAQATYNPIALAQRPALVNSVLSDNVICADSSSSDTCQGDSGGPLVSFQTGVQIGITSMGIDCASGVPGVYTSVSAYQDWILSQIDTITTTTV